MDPDLVVDEDIKQRLMNGGMDNLLATHFAHLFIRDPIVVFAEDLETLDLNKTDHFENLQSTNWQHMRFKPPPHDSDTGWRVEFRSMEIQMTDLENAAFAIFLVLVTRAILSFDLNFYIPIPLTTANMETAHIRDAVATQKFHFRNDPLPPPRPIRHVATGSGVNSGTATPTAAGHQSQQQTQTPCPSRPPTPTGPVEDEHSLMTIDEIINGQQKQPQAAPAHTTNGPFPTASSTSSSISRPSCFPGLIPLVESYLNSVNIDIETRCNLARYLDLIRRRAAGQLWTPARWMRHFVLSHTEYKEDSVVSEGIAYDLCRAAEEIARLEGRGPPVEKGESGEKGGGLGLGKEFLVAGWSSEGKLNGQTD